MTHLFHTTIYCCADCGTDFEFTKWTEEEDTPVDEPVLTCPRCSNTAFRVSREERNMIKEYVKLETKVLELILARHGESGGML